jgi:hypothetical protein
LCYNKGTEDGTPQKNKIKKKEKRTKKMTYTEAKTNGFYAVIRNSYTGKGLIVKTEEKAREYLQAPRYDKDGQPQEWFIDTLLKDYTPKTATIKTTTTTTETPTNKSWDEQRKEAFEYVLKKHNHEAIMTHLTAKF